MPQQHIMLDLETLGSRPGCIIASIGAVRFDAKGLQDTFYRRIDITIAQKEGFHMDADTVRWWLKQESEAQAELTKPGGLSTLQALQDFWTWVMTSTGDECRHLKDTLMWGNGASFDNAIMSASYHKLGKEQPWVFWNDRCYRTMKSLHPDIPLSKRTGTHHNALDDAISQAEHLILLPSFQEAYGK